MAHRGFNRQGLENSMVAFQAAVDLGYRYLETDVHATSDEVAVAVHDDTLDRVTDSRGAIARLPWSAVASARIQGQEPIPTLAELMDAWPDVRLNLDIKSGQAVLPTVRLIERMRAHDRVCIGSFSSARRREVVRRLSRPVATSAGQIAGAGFLAGTHLPNRIGNVAVRRSLNGVDALQVPVQRYGVPVVTKAAVAAAHRAGRVIHVWTINDVNQMHELLDLGVDGLISDRADLLKTVLMERGVWSS